MSSYTYTPKEVSNMLGLVDTYMRWRAEQTKNDRCYKHYHPSEWGHCLRKQQYKHYAELGYIETQHSNFDSRMLRLFDKGHNMHERWAHYFADIGVLRGCWKCKNEACYMFDDKGKLKENLSKKQINEILNKKDTRIYGTQKKLGVFRPNKCVCGCDKFEYEESAVEDKDLNIFGHCDLLIDCSKLSDNRFDGVRSSFAKKHLPTDGGVIVGDMKTCSSSAWKNQLDKRGPHPYYVIQLTCYIHILGCDSGLLMYENKNNSEMRWYKIERNEEWWKIIKWQAKTMIDMAKAKKLPPPRHKKSSYYCKGCEYRKLCHSSGIWNNPNLNELREQFYKDLL